MKKVLMVFAHPHRNESKVNRTILEVLQSLDGVTVSDIYEKYPFFHIRTSEEKRLMLDADMIWFQHPFYWYGMPPLLKLWFDEVLEFDFAYGPNGNALSGKTMQLSLTVGGTPQSYTSSGYHEFPVENFLLPYKQTAKLCGMDYLKPQIFYSSNHPKPEDVQNYAKQLRELVLKFQQGGSR